MIDWGLEGRGTHYVSSSADRELLLIHTRGVEERAARLEAAGPTATVDDVALFLAPRSP